jgi:hypothetical protein
MAIPPGGDGISVAIEAPSTRSQTGRGNARFSQPATNYQIIQYSTKNQPCARIFFSPLAAQNADPRNA